ncbi:MAG: hypothetical protein ACNA7G_02210 [Methylobacter sp.]
MLQEQIINEINHIPNDKLSELYDLIHYFRLGLLYEQQQLNTKQTYPLRGVKIRYEKPFESVAENDWEALK